MTNDGERFYSAQSVGPAGCKPTASLVLHVPYLAAWYTYLALSVALEIYDWNTRRVFLFYLVKTVNEEQRDVSPTLSMQ